MSYTFEHQQDFLSTLLADSNTDSESMFPLAKRKKELNHAEVQFAKDSRILQEYATGTIASMELALPSGWFETFAFIVTISSSDRLITRRREISAQDLERYGSYAGNIPYYYFWTFSGTRKIKFVGSSSAINGATYKIYYFKFPTTELDLDADTSELPEEYRQGPVFKAASNLLRQIGQYTRAKECLSEYNRLMMQAQQQSELWFTKVELPTPDLNIIEAEAVDIQGSGS